RTTAGVGSRRAACPISHPATSLTPGLPRPRPVAPRLPRAPHASRHPAPRKPPPTPPPTHNSPYLPTHPQHGAPPPQRAGHVASSRGLGPDLQDGHPCRATPGAAGGRVARRVQAAGKVRRPAAPAPAARPRSPGLGGLAVGDPGRPELFQPPAVQPAVEFVAVVQVADPAVED